MQLIQTNSFLTVQAMTFGQLFELCILKKEREGLKPRTIERYLCNYNNYIKREFENIPLSMITNTYMRNFLYSLSSKRCMRRHGLSPSSIKNVHSTMCGCFNYAKELELIDYNPADDIKIKLYRSHEIKTISTLDRVTLENYCLDNFYGVNLGIYVMLYTGIRIGEVSGLRWENVHLDDGFIEIKNQMNLINDYTKNAWDLKLTKPKSQTSERIIPLPSFLVDRLRKRSKNSGWVMEKDGNYISPKKLRYEFYKILNKLNIPRTNPHNIRHTFATQMIENGMNINALAKVLGHASPKVTMNIYLHTTSEKKKKSVNDIPFIYEVYSNEL